jgi:hypothetical protein
MGKGAEENNCSIGGLELLVVKIITFCQGNYWFPVRNSAKGGG